jgi:hypothetical protein
MNSKYQRNIYRIVHKCHQIGHNFHKKYKLSLSLPSLVSRAHPHPTVVRRQSSGGGAA